LVYVDDINGHINKISFNDIKEIVKLNNEMGQAGLTFNLVDDNRSMDLIINHMNKVMAFNFSGNLITEKNCDENLSFADYFSDESHAVFYALNDSYSSLYLFDQINNKTRKLSAGSMPLISNLFKDNKNYLLFPNGKQMTCVLLN
jgi:DNA-binding MltR family transcriptional regulator